MTTALELDDKEAANINKFNYETAALHWTSPMIPSRKPRSLCLHVDSDVLLCGSHGLSSNMSLTQFNLNNKQFIDDKVNYKVKDEMFGVPFCVSYDSITKSVMVGTNNGFIVNMTPQGGYKKICGVGRDITVWGIHVDNDVIWCVTDRILYCVDKDKKVNNIFDKQEEDQYIMQDVTTMNTNKNRVCILYEDKIRIVDIVTRSTLKCLGNFTVAIRMVRDLLNNCFVVNDRDDNKVVIINDDGVVIKTIKLSSSPDGVEIDHKNNKLYVLLRVDDVYGCIQCYKC